MARVFLNIHGTGDTVVLALCDEDLLGEELKYKGWSLRISEHFYGGKSLEPDSAAKEIRKAVYEYEDEKTVAINALGELACSVVVDAGLVKEDEIGELGGVPHVQIYILPREPFL
ncbi:DUF424 domain-containing protein [Methanopyrus sp.]